MSKKHNTIATPESRHLVAAEKEFADGWVKYALWNTVIDGPDEVSEANKSRYLQLRAERLAIEEGVVSRNRRKFRALWFLPGQSNITKTIGYNQAQLPLVERLFSL